MKKYQKALVLTVLIVIITALIVGCYLYFYKPKLKNASDFSITNSSLQASTTVSDSIDHFLGFDRLSLINQLHESYPTLPMAFPSNDAFHNIYNNCCQYDDSPIYANIINIDAGAAGNGYKVIFSEDIRCIIEACEIAHLSVRPQTIGGKGLTDSQLQTKKLIKLKDGLIGYQTPGTCGNACHHSSISFTYSDGALFDFSACCDVSSAVIWANSALPVVVASHAQSTKPNTILPNNNEASIFNVPPLYSGYSWRLASTTYPGHALAIELFSDNFDTIYPTLTGKFYVATNTDPGALAWKDMDAHASPDEPEAFYGGDGKIDNYYEQALSAKGYKNGTIVLDQNYNMTDWNQRKYLMSPMDSDGPYGSSRGWIKYSNGEIRVILVESLVDENRIFISDVVKIKDVISSN